MSPKNISIVKNKKYELVPPDGGWGYMISIAAVINYSTTTGFAGCFGMIFDGFMKEIGMNSTSVTILTGINAMCVAISGFLTSPLLKLLTMRQLALVAAVVFDLGVLGTVFVKSVVLFFICQGIMQGIGLGILYNLSCTIMNDYFVTRRLFAVSFVQCITAVNAMVMPIFIKWCLDKYEFRGTLLIMTGLTLHNFLAVALMQPVEWHMKRVEVPVENEMQLLIVDDEKIKSDVSTVKLMDIEALITMPEKAYNIPLDPQKKSDLRKIVESLLDVSICKSILLSCVSIGIALCLFADTTYSIMMPQALYSMGWDQDKVALALSLYCFGDLAARTVLIFTSKWMHYVGCQEIYIIGLVVAFLSRLGMLWSEKYITILVYITLMGVAHCTICVLIPLVVSEVVSPEKFTSALGIVLMLAGVVNLVVGPAVGAVRDLTNSYSSAFYILSSCFAIIVLFWSIELCYKKNKHKRVQKSDTSKSTNRIKANDTN